MKEIILLGGGGHCKSCIDVLENEGKYKIAGIIDDALYDKGVQEVLRYPLLGKDKDLQNLRKHYQYALITIGQIQSPCARINLYHKLKDLDYILPVIISPLAYVAQNVKISEGSIIMHHALVNTSSRIGKICIINTKALIEHDCIIEDFCHISTGAILNGGCTVGKETFIGSNMSLKHNVKIPQGQIYYFNVGGGGNKINFPLQGGKCV
ncbi:NeuD/PglB/VioB family sugar acetyltransferase [Helicobacter cholecystus]|uniref:NeuD/PglB/VioB family sugar acetyltransferase n=1 Tax=Helicobacter cholecystus TaxID=45498 RepID=UPI0027382DF7|nr:NeuD/PglB/VioB family sugar acetyltransferase [Helicobacter cholecystus]